MLMKLALRIARIQLGLTVRSAKTWICVLIGLLISASATQGYIEAALQLGYAHQIVEPVLTLLTDRLMIVFTAIAIAFLLSDVPGRMPVTPYLVFRTGRCAWMLGNIFYIGCICAGFIILIIACSALLCAPYAYAQNLWSPLARLLGSGQTIYQLRSFRSIDPAILYGFFPYQAVALQALLLCLYALCICGCMLLCNVITRRNMGFSLAMTIHGLMFVMYLDGHPIGFACSLFTHAFLGVHVSDGMALEQSLLLFFLFAACVFGASVVLSKRINIER